MMSAHPRTALGDGGCVARGHWYQPSPTCQAWPSDPHLESAWILLEGVFLIFGFLFLRTTPVADP